MMIDLRDSSIFAPLDKNLAVRLHLLGVLRVGTVTSLDDIEQHVHGKGGDGIEHSPPEDFKAP